MPYKVCNEPGCPRHAAPGKSMCPPHAAEQRKANRSPFNAFYASKAWAMTRKQQLFDQPLCEHELNDGSTCGRVAEVVHHRLDLRAGGAPRDPKNLASLCKPHHDAITRARQTSRQGREGGRHHPPLR